MHPISKPIPLPHPPLPQQNTHDPAPLVAGDRVAFITQGRYPRTLCGIVVDASLRDRNDRPLYRVRTARKTYVARHHSTRKLVRK